MQGYIAGIDVGGTTIKLAIFPMEGDPILKWEIKTPTGENVGQIWKAMSDSIQEKLKELNIDKAELKGVGMGLPGPIQDNGYIPRCVNLGMGACYPAKELEAFLGVPVKVGNDATVAGLGEVMYGAAKGYNNAIMFTLGTGVGGGVVIQGKALNGGHGIAGEVGHFVVNPEEEEACNCGNKGCLEQYASATGIVCIAKRLIKNTEIPSALREIPDFTAKDVCDEAKKGDALGLEVIDVFGKYMGLAVSYVMQTFDPEVVIIGGGVSRAGQILIDAIKKHLSKYMHIAENPADIVLATLGNDAGSYGAAALAKEVL